MKHYPPRPTHVKTPNTVQEVERESHHRRMETGPLVVRSGNNSILSQEKQGDKRQEPPAETETQPFLFSIYAITNDKIACHVFESR
jgi:hypothetical protein